MTKRAKNVTWVLIVLLVLSVGSVFCVWRLNLFHTHEHCIKISGSALRTFATDHEGRFPYHTNGFGDALLLLVKEDALQMGDTNTGEYTIRFITGPGDDGRIFKEALKTGGDVPEEKCSRVYVQGLKESSNGNIAILFDRKSIAGGDHFRRPWGPLVREVCMLDGTMQTVPEEKWAAFSKEQIELLVEAGIERSIAEQYYQSP